MWWTCVPVCYGYQSSVFVFYFNWLMGNRLASSRRPKKVQRLSLHQSIMIKVKHSWARWLTHIHYSAISTSVEPKLIHFCWHFATKGFKQRPMLSMKKNNIDGEIDTLLMLAIACVYLVHALAVWVGPRKHQTDFQEAQSDKPPPLLSIHVWITAWGESVDREHADKSLETGQHGSIRKLLCFSDVWSNRAHDPQTPELGSTLSIGFSGQVCRLWLLLVETGSLSLVVNVVFVSVYCDLLL